MGCQMRHESGESVEEPGEGYEIKLGHVDDALQRISMKGIDVAAFDAASDEPAGLTGFLVSKVAKLRAARCSSARATIGAVDEMLRNVQAAEALAILDSVNRGASDFFGAPQVPEEGE